MKFLKKILSRGAVFKELLSFLWKHKLWWMMPVVFVFLIMGLLIWFAQSSAVVPFVYTLF